MGLDLTSFSGLKHLFQTARAVLGIMACQQVFFKLSRGTKQGYPLSPYLFILVLEILFIQVRNDPSVEGFKTDDIEIKLSAFADDTIFFVRNKESLDRLLNIMRKFAEFSSLHRNVEKCEANMLDWAFKV